MPMPAGICRAAPLMKMVRRTWMWKMLCSVVWHRDAFRAGRAGSGCWLEGAQRAQRRQFQVRRAAFRGGGRAAAAGEREGDSGDRDDDQDGGADSGDPVPAPSALRFEGLHPGDFLPAAFLFLSALDTVSCSSDLPVLRACARLVR
jgi:hypothetical protein